MMRDEQRWHARLIHADADAVARDARLRNFKYRATNAVAIADAHLAIEKSLDGEVFAELAKGKIAPAQKTLPVMVRVHLIDKYRALFSTVTREIGLLVTIDVELPHHSPSTNWRFPD
jgi:hypothetical protein